MKTTTLLAVLALATVAVSAPAFAADATTDRDWTQRRTTQSERRTERTPTSPGDARRTAAASHDHSGGMRAPQGTDDALCACAAQHQASR